MKRFIAIFLCFTILMGLASCKPIENEDSRVEIWSVPVSQKILLDGKYSAEDKLKKLVEIEMAKGEYENGQLIVTALTDIKKVELKAADLKDAHGNVISKENIEILFEKYINIEYMSSLNMPNQFGYWPDALVPMENIALKNENFIKNSNNQGFIIKVYTPVDTSAGLYQANFTLEYDGKSMAVPVKVRVWDFVVPQETHLKSSFHNTRDYIMQGELDASEEMYEKYFDKLLDYRISVNYLPVFDNEISTYVEKAKKYAADSRCASYNLTIKYKNEHVRMDGVIDKYIPNIDYEHMKELLKALAAESTPELNLIKKLYVYDITVDEPQGTNRIADANYKQIMHIRTLQETVNELKAQNFDWAAHGLTEEDILKIEFVITGKYIPSMTDIRTYCPLTNDISTAEQRQFYYDLIEASRESGEDPYRTLWCYVAWEPQYPYANFRIEESSLGIRVLGWMMKNYDIRGFLYWGTSVYPAIPEDYEGFTIPRDVWTDPYSFLQRKVTADGCLTYPGKPYGLDGFISSIRLESVRDCFEDYEYLWLLEQLLIEASQKYGRQFNFDSIMSSIYEKLYVDIIPNYLDENFIEARKEVAAMIELLSGDMNGLVFIENLNPENNTADIVIYADEEAEVEADGTLLSGDISGSGKVYRYTFNMVNANNYVNLTFRRGESEFTVTKYIGKRNNFIQIFDADSINFLPSRGDIIDPKDHITLSRISESIAGLSNKTLRVDIGVYNTDDEMAQITYRPYISITAKKAFGDITADKIDGLYFTIYNATNENKSATLFLCYQSTEKAFKQITLAPGINRIAVNQIYLDTWRNLKLTDNIKIVFEKADNLDTYYLDNMYFTVK